MVACTKVTIPNETTIFYLSTKPLNQYLTICSALNQYLTICSAALQQKTCGLYCKAWDAHRDKNNLCVVISKRLLFSDILKSRPVGATSTIANFKP